MISHGFPDIVRSSYLSIGNSLIGSFTGVRPQFKIRSDAREFLLLGLIADGRIPIL
jgi:hypothetical protein